jgi:hypothetical protein
LGFSTIVSFHLFSERVQFVHEVEEFPRAQYNLMRITAMQKVSQPLSEIFWTVGHLYENLVVKMLVVYRAHKKLFYSAHALGSYLLDAVIAAVVDLTV